MKPQPSKWIRFARPGAAGLVLVQSLQAATVLSGSGLPNNDPVPADHGSFQAGTPDIGLTWSATNDGLDANGDPAPPNNASYRGWQAYNVWPGGGEVYQVDGRGLGYQGNVGYSVAFTPGSATIAVSLVSVDLNDWVGGPDEGGIEDTILSWSITGSVSGLLGSGAGIVVPDGTVVNLPLGVQGLGGEILTLTFTPTGGSGSYFAIDNLSFDQVTVPEPSGAILAAAGLGAMAMRRRRK